MKTERVREREREKDGEGIEGYTRMNEKRQTSRQRGHRTTTYLRSIAAFPIREFRALSLLSDANSVLQSGDRSIDRSNRSICT
jgi:hypothetical protein